MWQMFVVIFIKRSLLMEISNVKKTNLAKGKMNIIGNKGCVGYSFILRDRIFNFIGCHLKPG
jgi:hypothetical protein